MSLSPPSPVTSDPAFADVYDESIVRPDGRVVAWTRSGAARDTPGAEGGIPVLRMPGTPGSRWTLRSDRNGWSAAGVEMITVERPGYGRSTRLPGRGFAEHCDDLAAVLDHLGLDRVRVVGTSGGGPHALAFAARHPDRVVAASVLVGLAPVTDEEAEQMIDINRASQRLAAAGDEAGMREHLLPPYRAMFSDPLATIADLMAQSPASDRAIMADPAWRKAFEVGVREAFAQGVDGWVDEALVLGGEWGDIDLSALRASLTWWHGRADRNCPWPAVERLIGELPTATLRDFGDAGHFEPFLRDAEILDELLKRG